MYNSTHIRPLYFRKIVYLHYFQNELHFVGKYWRMSGRPTMAILIREENMRDSHFRQLLELLAMLKSGNCYGLKVRLGRLQNLMNSACIEHLDFLDLVPDELAPKLQCLQQFENPHTGYTSLTDIPTVLEYDEPLKNYSEYTKRSTEEIVEALRHVDTLYGQSQLLGVLWQRCGVHYNIDGANLEDRMERLTRQVTLKMRLFFFAGNPYIISGLVYLYLTSHFGYS